VVAGFIFGHTDKPSLSHTDAVFIYY